MADIYGRTGGPFLDQIELEDKERKAAAVEGREPDFSPINLQPLEDHVVTIEVDPWIAKKDIVATVTAAVNAKIDDSPAVDFGVVAELTPDALPKPLPVVEDIFNDGNDSAAEPVSGDSESDESAG